MKRILNFILLFGVVSSCAFAADSTKIEKRKDYEKTSSYTKYFTLDNRFQVGPPSFEFVSEELDYLQMYNSVYSFQSFRTDGGRLGAPNQLMEYCLPLDLGFIYNQNVFDSWGYTQENTRFYQTKTPYSFVYNVNNFGKEDLFRACFTQNVARGLNFSIDYSVLNSPVASFANSETYQSHFRVYTNYFSKGGRYMLNAGYIRNVAKINENGGIVDDSIYFSGKQTNPNFIRVNLYDAYTERKENSYFLNQTYWIYSDKKDSIAENDKAFGFIRHNFELDDLKLKYRDQFAVADSFYDNAYINPMGSNDTLRILLIKNSLSYFTSDFERVHKSIDVKWMVGARNEYSIIRNAITYAPSSEWYAFSKLRFVLKKRLCLDFLYESQFGTSVNPESKMEAMAKFNFDTSSSHLSSLDGVSFTGGVQNKSSFQMYQYYFSNHFYWNNQFDNQQMMYLQGKIQYRGWSLEAIYSNISNYQYLAKEGPKMASEDLMVYKLHLQKRLRFKWFIWDNSLIYQQASNPSYLHLPAIALKQSYIAEFNIKKIAKLQVGVDAFYNTSYYGDAYMPALASYYWQDEILTGNHLVADAYLNVKIKSVLAFLKVTNATQGLIGNYSTMMTPNYPISPRGFYFGVLWKFFD